MLRLGVFGGSFDPVHYGHLRMAEVAREAAGLDRVLFVPTQMSPFKAGRTQTPAEHRLEMLRLAVESNVAFGVSEIEVRRPGLSYTVDTLRQLKTENPEAELHFLTGTDAVKELPRWREPETVITLARFLVVTRPGVNKRDVLDALPDTYEERIAFIDMPGLDISSSYLRECWQSGCSVRYLMPRSVEAYIRQHELYRGESGIG